MVGRALKDSLGVGQESDRVFRHAKRGEEGKACVRADRSDKVMINFLLLSRNFAAESWMAFWDRAANLLAGDGRGVRTVLDRDLGLGQKRTETTIVMMVMVTMRGNRAEGSFAALDEGLEGWECRRFCCYPLTKVSFDTLQGVPFDHFPTTKYLWIRGAGLWALDLSATGLDCLGLGGSLESMILWWMVDPGGFQHGVSGAQTSCLAVHDYRDRCHASSPCLQNL